MDDWDGLRKAMGFKNQSNGTGKYLKWVPVYEQDGRPRLVKKDAWDSEQNERVLCWLQTYEPIMGVYQGYETGSGKYGIQANFKITVDSKPMILSSTSKPLLFALCNARPVKGQAIRIQRFGAKKPVLYTVELLDDLESTGSPEVKTDAPF